MAADADVMLKPKDVPTTDFKRAAFTKLSAESEVLAVIDNSTKNLIEMQKVAPKTTKFVLITTRLEGVPGEPGKDPPAEPDPGDSPHTRTDTSDIVTPAADPR